MNHWTDSNQFAMIRNLLLCLLLLTVVGCASNPPNGPVHDPWENVNRGVYRFNTALDNAIIKPAAKGYRFVLPDFLENGIGNFFSNLGDINVVINDLLQGKLKRASSDTGRFLVNSTVGILGFIDVGTRIGLPKHFESFGQTFGVWGLGEGPFVMLPLFGPNNVRTTVGIVPETFTTYPFYIEEAPVSFAVQAVELISLRAYLLAAGNLLDTAALDPYLLLRDFWIQRHRQATFEGTRPVSLGNGLGEGDDELDELDKLDELDELDELDRLDQLDRLDEIDNLDQLNQSEQPEPAVN